MWTFTRKPDGPPCTACGWCVDEYICTNPKILERDIVDGKVKARPARDLRLGAPMQLFGEGKCGREARFFVARQRQKEAT